MFIRTGITTYEFPRKVTLEEELEGTAEPMSEFERALKELGVEVIHAYSPQAKGSKRQA